MGPTNNNILFFPSFTIKEIFYLVDCSVQGSESCRVVYKRHLPSPFLLYSGGYQVLCQYRC